MSADAPAPDSPPEPATEICNEAEVERLVNAALTGMEKAAIPVTTTVSEVVSAAFVLLARLLAVVYERGDVRYQNTRQVRRALQELMDRYGQVPH